MPRLQEAKRHQAYNAQVYGSRFATLNALVQEYGLDDESVWNLDETGCTPGRGTNVAQRKRRFMRRAADKDA